MRAGKITIDLTAGTAAFDGPVDSSTGRLRNLGRTADGTRKSLRGIGDAGHYSVTGLQALSGGLRVAEGNLGNNIRAAERFLATIPGLAKAAQFAFPAIGAIALLGVLGELIKKADELYEAFKKMRDAPDKIAQDFRNINLPLAVRTDQGAISNDKLENSISKLEGRPENMLKLELDEAKLAADQLAEGLNKDLEALVKLLTENHVPWWQKLLGRAGTDDIEKQFKELAKNVGAISDKYGDKLFDVNPGTTPSQLKGAKKQTDQITAAQDKELEDTLTAALNDTKAKLAAAREAQKQHDHPPVAQGNNFDDYIIDPKYGIPMGYKPGRAPKTPTQPNGSVIQPRHTDDQIVDIKALEGGVRSLRQQILDIRQKRTGTLLQSQEEDLEAKAQAESLTHPYTSKLHELDAEVDGLNARLASIGKGSSAETLAKSWAKAKEEIAKYNDEAKKAHHPQLTVAQQFTIAAKYEQVGNIEAEVEWKTKLDQTNTSIDDRIQSIKSLTAAIGQGYAAERAALVQEQLFQALGKDKDKLGDEKWMNARELDDKGNPTGPTHRESVAALTTKIGTEVDAQRTEQIKSTLHQIADEIELENALADAEGKGAEAVRQATLAVRERQTARANTPQAAKDLSVAQRKLSDVQVEKTANTAIANLDQELAATERLTQAQIGGAEAIRKAQLENKVAEIRRNVAPEFQQAEINKTTQLSEAQHQEQILTEAIKTGITYQNQLQSIDEQISALKTVHGTQEQMEVAAISLNKLEEERAHIYTEQVSVLGSARDGMKAFFDEMATEGVSAAKEVHDTLKSAFDSLNDTLAKAIGGQKVSWSGFFSSISADIAKMSLKNLEAQFAARIHIAPTGQPGQPQGGGILARLGRGIGGVFAPQDQHKGGLPPLKPGALRDGQSSGTALYVTSVSQQGQPSVSSRPDPGQSSTSEAIDAASSRAALDLPHVGGSPISGPAVSAVSPGLKDIPDVTSRLLDDQGFPVNNGSQPIPQPNTAPVNAAINAGAKVLSVFERLFRGAFEDGGDADSGGIHLVGEDGPELFVPDDDGTIIPNYRLSEVEKLQQEQRGQANATTRNATQPDATQQADSLAAQNQLANEISAGGGDPKAFDNTKSASKLSNVSLPTRSPSFVSALIGALGAGVSAGVKGLSGLGGGSTPLGPAADQQPGWSGNAAPPPDSDPSVYLSQIESPGSPAGPSRLSQLENIGGSFAGLAVGLIARLFQGTPNHHFKPGRPYTLPEFNGYFATGGDVKAGKSHVVGEKGEELFVPEGKRLSDLTSSMSEPSEDRSSRAALDLPRVGDSAGAVAPMVRKGLAGLAAAGGSTRRGMTSAMAEAMPDAMEYKPFGGYRAAGGDVDPSYSYMIGEQGSELWTPPAVGGSVVSNDSLSDMAGGSSKAPSTVYIDARSSDPAAVEQRVRQGMSVAHNAAVRTAFRSVQEFNKRTPQLS